MTTGIYKITFPDNSFYIGKSINVEERWKQHMDKMTKGTAAKPMQAKWNKFGKFKALLIIECHEDHMDILEETFIARLNPPLNTTRPKDRLPGIYDEAFDIILPYFEVSTLHHIHNILELDAMNKQLGYDYAQLEELVEKLRTQRSEEEIQADISDRIEDLTDLKDLLEEELASKNKDILALQEELQRRDATIKDLMKPWWKRIFS